MRKLRSAPIRLNAPAVPSIPLPIILAAFLCAFCASTLHAQVRGSLWNDPKFQKALQYSFAINTDIEPTMTDVESEAYNQIVNLIGSDPDRALELIDQVASQIEDPSAMWNFLRGNIHFQRGKNDLAEQEFLVAIEKFETFLRAYQNLGTIYVQAAKHELAIENLTKVIELGGGDGLLYGLLGVSYLTLEQYIPAEIAFRQAILLKPDIDDWKLGLARTLLQQQRYGEVVALTNQMIRTKPENAMLWTLQTSAYIGAKDIPAAASTLEILKRLGKADSKTLKTLADIYTNEGLMELAAENYIASHDAQGGGDADALVQAANILLDRKAVSEAETVLAKAEDVLSGAADIKQEVELLKLRSKLADARGDAAESAAFMEQVVEKDPLDGDALLALGKYFSDAKDEDGNAQVERAKFFYERAQNLPEYEADANLRLAQLLVKEGKYDDAIPLLKRAQDVKPRDSVAKFLDELERYAKSRR